VFQSTIDPQRYLELRRLLVDESMSTDEAAEAMGLTKRNVQRIAQMYPRYFEDTQWIYGLPIYNKNVGKRKGRDMFRDYRLMGGSEGGETAIARLAVFYRVSPDETRRAIAREQATLGDERLMTPLKKPKRAKW